MGMVSKLRDSLTCEVTLCNMAMEQLVLILLVILSPNFHLGLVSSHVSLVVTLLGECFRARITWKAKREGSVFVK
jgi:hypothetical protein